MGVGLTCGGECSLRVRFCSHSSLSPCSRSPSPSRSFASLDRATDVTCRRACQRPARDHARTLPCGRTGRGATRPMSVAAPILILPSLPSSPPRTRPATSLYSASSCQCLRSTDYPNQCFTRFRTHTCVAPCTAQASSSTRYLRSPPRRPRHSYISGWQQWDGSVPAGCAEPGTGGKWRIRRCESRRRERRRRRWRHKRRGGKPPRIPGRAAATRACGRSWRHWGCVAHDARRCRATGRQ